MLPLDKVKHAIAVDYDVSTGFVYWTDDEVRTIQRAKMDGQGNISLIISQIPS